MPDTNQPEPRIDAAPTEAAPAPRPAPAAARAAPGRRRLLRLALLVVVPAVLVLGALYAYAVGGRWVGTDNAYVQADIVCIAPEISGVVASIEVVDNQRVAAGDVLFRIEDSALRYALDQAEADLSQVANDLAGLKAGLEQKQDMLARAVTTADYKQRDLDRIARLAANGNASQSALEDAREAGDEATSAVTVARADIAVLLAGLSGDPDLALDDYPPYRQALARRNRARLDLDHAVVRAPFDGIATQVDALQPGGYVAMAEPALAIVRADGLWIEANMNETDLTAVAVGQPVTLTVDTYPGETWTGRVAGISPASGAQFALLPAQNSSGNWVKVTQRIPVRIAIDAEGHPPLRAGMSTEVAIDTGRSRGLPFLDGTAFGAE